MQRTWKPTTAGILSIVAGAIGIGRGIFVIVLGGFLAALSGLTASELSEVIEKWARTIVPGITNIPEIIAGTLGVASTLVLVLGILSLAFGIVALIGGIYAVRRRVWGLALAGSILALPSSTLLGVLSIIFVSLGKGEFASSKS